MISANVVLDSKAAGVRLTTLELTYPRFIHAELLTHRDFSRNSASSRAVPLAKAIEEAEKNPAYPSFWGKNQSGMSADYSLPPRAQDSCRILWNEARRAAIRSAKDMLLFDLHKQTASRILEPYLHITVLVSSTRFANFFSLRRARGVQPEMQELADCMYDAMQLSRPESRKIHAPLVDDLWAEGKLQPLEIMKVSAGRCARVSYMTHKGNRDIVKDIELCDKLIANRHWSPLEHVAYIDNTGKGTGNFDGWRQFRADHDRVRPSEQPETLH